MWFYGLSKDWESRVGTFSISQNGHAALRKPSHLSVPQPASPQPQRDTGRLPAGLGLPEDVVRVARTHGASQPVSNTEKLLLLLKITLEWKQTFVPQNIFVYLSTSSFVYQLIY